jgi:formylglycine-generating enzyme required for sulfatase activity
MTDIYNSPMIEIPAGEFLRGSGENLHWDIEEPMRNIYIDTFSIGKYPVTNRQFREFVEENNIAEPLYWRDPQWNGADAPVVGVSWYECDAFCRWLSQKTGLNYRLPTEAEWEKASRGVDGRIWPWGNDFDEQFCNFDEMGLGHTTPVGSFPKGASPYGCLDMAGNVWEWCRDYFADHYYNQSPSHNPTGPAAGQHRVMRGGCWFGDRDNCRCACRGSASPHSRLPYTGFRLARSL